MNRRNPLPIAVSLSIFSLVGAGCAVGLNAPSVQEAEQDHGLLLSAELGGVDRALARDETGFGTSEWLEVEDFFDRVGVRFDAEGPVEIQVRTSHDGGHTASEWRPLELTYKDGIAHNAHLDVDMGATHVQVRSFAPVESRLSFIAVEPVVRPSANGEAGLDAVDSSESQALVDGVIPRSSWGASSSNCWTEHFPQKITLHHTVTPNQDSMSVEARVRQIQSYHQNTRGWCDVGYHFLVSADGLVYQGRDEGLVGAHVAYNNTGNVGIALLGNYSAAEPGSPMVSAAAGLIAQLADEYTIELDRDHVKGHREYKATACPGDHVAPEIDEIVETAQNLLLALNAPETEEEPVLIPEPEEPTSTDYDWYCPDSWYGTDDGCDCGCGAPDPDCGGAVDVGSCDFGIACGGRSYVDPDDISQCLPW